MLYGLEVHMAQHRANPIPETLESVPGLPDHVKVYRIPASSYWYVRASFDGRRVVHSLKTEAHATAMAEARKWFLKMLVKQEIGQPLTSGSDFKRVAEALLEDEKERVKSGERKQSLVDDFKYIYSKDLLPFFKSVALQAINKAKIAEYMTTHLGPRNLSSRTKKNHLMHLHKILAKAEDLKLIERIPSFPKISLKQTPREWFNSDQYAHLINVMGAVIEKEVKVGGVVIGEHLQHLTEFMVATFLRVTDIKNLKNEHIRVVHKADHSYLVIMARGKVAPSPVVSTTAAVHLYERYLGGDPEDYVFFNQYGRDHAMGVMAKQFKYVLEKAGLYEVEGSKQTRDLTSLRHTAIMRQLLNGEIPLKVLADNCRTSIQMISKFYGVHSALEKAATQFYQDDGIPKDTSIPF
jgi:hypothetical protein